MGLIVVDPDILYYRQFLNDFLGPRIYTPPTIFTPSYLESSMDLLYYRGFLAKI